MSSSTMVPPMAYTSPKTSSTRATFMDTIGTISPSGAAGNGDGWQWEGVDVGAFWAILGPKTCVSCGTVVRARPTDGMVTATATSALAITLASICATAGYLGMLGRGEMLVEPTVKLGTVVFDDDDDLAAEMHCRLKK
eukprot:CAMPEP_0202004620 /NCGR_PEP_ID=MMETSP0905-20130828/9880_1 /ASSEMBLY_ACC=CAM_ASM_000554 /TAXON_ID=420261 /ORGANISM="Thalassiosira antarctica, Strain CCMP982" /LENGTH=137 /DNA_ID=CAMNT_0048562001 /DNA_START=66 /DNA_END=481 /DNA_ORIENTATION=-